MLGTEPYHFVGSLSPSQRPDLLRIPHALFQPLEGDNLDRVLAG